MAALEVLTDEGISALQTAVATGARLVVEYAVMGDKADLGVDETVDAYRRLTAAQLRATREGSGALRAWSGVDQDRVLYQVSALPSQVTIDTGTPEGETAAQLEPRYALDFEFQKEPQASVMFDTIAVFARLYYAMPRYEARQEPYRPGDVVWYVSGGVTSYYKCIVETEVTAGAAQYGPASDTSHWEAVEASTKTAGSNPPMRALEQGWVLLHVSTTDGQNQAGPGLGMHYKLRLFLHEEAFDTAGAETFPVYLDSPVTGTAGAVQLGFLAEMAKAMADMRTIISNGYGRQ